MWKLLTLILVIVGLLVSNPVSAQEIPTVEILLSQPTAQQGETIGASVRIRGAVDVAGVDIGISINNQCLRIVDRQEGDFISPSNGGTFTALSEINDYDTRLAIAVTDRSKRGNGDGIFYTVQLEVICAEGAGSIEFTHAQLGAYEDPEATIVTMVPFQMSLNNINTITATLSIGPEGQVTAVPTEVREVPSVPVTNTQDLQSTQIIMIVLVLLVMGTLIGLIVYAVMRYRRR